jgi:hypothetical protein
VDIAVDVHQVIAHPARARTVLAAAAAGLVSAATAGTPIASCLIAGSSLLGHMHLEFRGELVD